MKPESILYLSENKERAKAFLNCLRLQLPSHQNTLGSIGRVTYSGRNVNIEGKTYADLLLQLQQRRNTLSGRDVLRQAAELVKNDSRIKLTEGEKASLFIFKSRLNKLTAAQAKRLDILEQKNAILDGRSPKEVTGDEKIELRKVQNNLDTVNGMIKRFNDDVLRVEHTDVLKNVLQKSRGIVEAEVKAKYDGKLSEYKAKRDEREAEIVQKYRDRIKTDREKREESETVKKYRARVEKKVQNLSDKLLKNSDKEHVPQALQKPLGEFLETIDFTSRRALRGGEATKADLRYADRLDRLRQVLQKQADYMADPNGDDAKYPGFYLDLPSELLDVVQKSINDANSAMKGLDLETNEVYSMDAAQLKDLDFILSVISHSINTLNTTLANARYANIPDMAKASMKHFEQMGNASQASSLGIAKYVLWKNATPYQAGGSL